VEIEAIQDCFRFSTTFSEDDDDDDDDDEGIID